MKKSILFSIIMFVCTFSINAQNDTMYVMKNGNIVGKYNVNTEVDSVIFYQLVTQSDSTPNGEIKAEIKTYYSLQNKIAAEFQATLSDTITDEFAHSERLLAWIQQQPEVEEAVMHDVYVFDVKHTNGMTGNILFRPKQTDVMKMTRGGGGKTDGTLRSFSKSDDKLITNKNVLVILQYAKDFYAPYNTRPKAKHLQDFLDLFEYADIDFEVILKVNEGLSSFLDLSNYGIIVFNTHGTPTGLCSGTDIFSSANLVAFSDDVEVADLPQNAAKQLRSKELKLTTFWEYESLTQQLTIQNATYELTFSFFQSLPVQFDNTVLIGNYCYSGIKNGIMGDILEPKGLKSFYGYGYNNGFSMEVTNELCYRAEDTIITNLIARDTTGIAHLANGTTQLQDDVYWREIFTKPYHRKAMAEKFFIFGPQTLNHYLDKGYQFEDCGDTITDKRDGQKYPTVCIGNQEWMAKNLNWAGAGKCYDDNPANCDIYGRLYHWEEANNDSTSNTNPSGIQGVCPAGWHMPSENEWVKLLDYLGGRQVAGGKMKSTSLLWSQPNEGATNSSGFSALPGGYMDSSMVGAAPYVRLDYKGIGGSAMFWSSTEEDDLESYYRQLGYKWNEVAVGSISRKRWMSVRCVKD